MEIIINATIPDTCDFRLSTNDEINRCVKTHWIARAHGRQSPRHDRNSLLDLRGRQHRDLPGARPGAPEFIAYAAFDAGLIDIEPGTGGASLRCAGSTGDRQAAATIEEIESLTARSCARTSASAHLGELPPLPARSSPTSRRRCRTTSRAAACAGSPGSRIATCASPFSRTCTGCSTTTRVSDRRCRRSCSRTAASVRSRRCRSSLAELLPNPYEFRVAGATAFAGMDSLAELRALPAPPASRTTSCATSSRCGSRTRCRRTGRRCCRRCSRRRTR